MIDKKVLVCGGTVHKCDNCEKSDGRPTLFWKKRNFDLCYECLSSLFFEHSGYFDKKKEKVLISRQAISEKLREEILERDNYKCVQCKSVDDLQIDHKIPFCLGGRTIKDNLQTLCGKCNRRKGGRDSRKTS